MTLSQLSSREAVLQAIAECDVLGDEEFLGRYGFGHARSYRLIYEGTSYDSKAIAGVAHGYQFPERGPLRSNEFSGGRQGAAGHLERLGFEIINDGAPSAASRENPSRVRGERTADEPWARPTTVIADAILIGCVKGKRGTACPAMDLYTSPLFLKRRAYAESSGRPWFILSALHGLVRPDTVIEPYDMALKAQPATYRREWATRVVADLRRAFDRIADRTFEIHAGDAYVAALRGPVAAAGAAMSLPLAGLRMGEQLGWYGLPSSRPLRPATRVTPDDVIQMLTDPNAATPAADFPWSRTDLRAPGLYGWWIDASGAHELSAAIGHVVLPGLVYVGQAGATRWPSGSPSGSTLLSRIGENHLRGRVTGSTWRRTLASILSTTAPFLNATGNWDRDSEARLSAWMHSHLRVVAIPIHDADTLGDLEKVVLRILDPPLNIEGLSAGSIRVVLSEMRRSVRQHEPSNPRYSRERQAE